MGGGIDPVEIRITFRDTFIYCELPKARLLVIFQKHIKLVTFQFGDSRKRDHFNNLFGKQGAMQEINWIGLTLPNLT